MFEGTLVTSFLPIFMSLLDEKTVRAMNETIMIARILKTRASLITKGFLRLDALPLKLTNPLFDLIKLSP